MNEEVQIIEIMHCIIKYMYDLMEVGFTPAQAKVHADFIGIIRMKNYLRDRK